MESWARLALLSLGGVLGVNARFAVTQLLTRWVGTTFPWATVFVNVSGSFAAGVLAALLAAWQPHPNVRVFALVGFLGGFTTFSAFALESLTLAERGHIGGLLGNVLGSVGAGLLAVVLGAALGRGLVGPPTLSPPPPPSSAQPGPTPTPERSTPPR